MTFRLAKIRYITNFELNLQSIEAFWADSRFVCAYDCLLDDLIDTVTVNLKHPPRTIRSFMLRQPEPLQTPAAL